MIHQIKVIYNFILLNSYDLSLALLVCTHDVVQIALGEIHLLNLLKKQNKKNSSQRFQNPKSQTLSIMLSSPPSPMILLYFFTVRISFLLSTRVRYLLLYSSF